MIRDAFLRRPSTSLIAVVVACLALAAPASAHPTAPTPAAGVAASPGGKITIEGWVQGTRAESGPYSILVARIDATTGERSWPMACTLNPIFGGYETNRCKQTGAAIVGHRYQTAVSLWTSAGWSYPAVSPVVKAIR